MYGDGRMLLGIVSAFTALEGWPFPPQCSCHPPEDASDPVLSNWKSNQSWLEVLDLPIKQPPNQSHASLHAYG